MKRPLALSGAGELHVATAGVWGWWLERDWLVAKYHVIITPSVGYI